LQGKGAPRRAMIGYGLLVLAILYISFAVYQLQHKTSNIQHKTDQICNTVKADC
jgi:hypothetical protein